MLRLRAAELLNERGLSKYSLYKEFGMSYQNFSNMINNKTASIKYFLILRPMSCLNGILKIKKDGQ